MPPSKICLRKSLFDRWISICQRTKFITSKAIILGCNLLYKNFAFGQWNIKSDELQSPKKSLIEEAYFVWYKVTRQKSYIRQE